MAEPSGDGSGAASGHTGAAPERPSIAERLRRYGRRFLRYGGRLLRWLAPRWLALVHTPLHIAAALTMLGLLAWTVVDIAGRTLFNAPMRGTVELTELAVVVLVYLGLARAESRDAHIAVDLLYVRLGVRAQLALRVFAGVVSLVVIAVLTWRLYLYAGQLDAGGYTTGILRVPHYPVALLAVLGAASFGLAVLANTVASLLALVRRR